jgi:hypothetical protein
MRYYFSAILAEIIIKATLSVPLGAKYFVLKFFDCPGAIIS